MAEQTTGQVSDSGPDENAGADGQKGKQESATEVKSPQNGGIAGVFKGGPDVNAGADGQKENPKQEQSGDGSNFPAWMSQVTKELYADKESAARLSGFKTVSDMAKAYLEAQTKAGEQSDVPKEADGYSFAKEDPRMAGSFFNAKLTAAQADSLYKANLAAMDDARKAMQASLAKDYQETDVLLQKEYGDKYDEAMILMKKGMGINPANGELSPLALLLVEAGLAGKPEICRAFIELGRSKSESSTASGSSTAGGPQSVMDGKGLHYKDQY
jgi:hypothetical protein